MAPQELHQRAEVRDDCLDHAMRPRRLAVAPWLAHDHAHEHRGQREGGAGDVGGGPADAVGEHQGERAGRGGADAPAVLGHARTGAELARLEELDAVGIDDDVEGGAGDADRDGGDRHHVERLPRIGHPQEGDGRHDQHADEPQPAAPLSPTADHRQADVVDHRRPQKLEVVRQDGEHERGDCALGDAVLGEARGERRAQHREHEARGQAQEQRRDGRGFEIGSQPLRQPPAQPAKRAGSHSR